MATYRCEAHQVQCTISTAPNGRPHHAVRVAWSGGGDCLLMQAPTVAQVEAAMAQPLPRLVLSGPAVVLEQIERVPS